LISIYLTDALLFLNIMLTIPHLISLFGVVEEITIEDNQYGDLFIIEWEDGRPQLRIEQVGK